MGAGPLEFRRRLSPSGPPDLFRFTRSPPGTPDCFRPDRAPVTSGRPGTSPGSGPIEGQVLSRVRSYRGNVARRVPGPEPGNRPPRHCDRGPTPSPRARTAPAFRARPRQMRRLRANRAGAPPQRSRPGQPEVDRTPVLAEVAPSQLAACHVAQIGHTAGVEMSAR